MSRGMRWIPVAGLQLTVRRGRRALAISVAHAERRWVVLALVTGREHDMQRVMEDHGHEHVGTFDKLDEALRAAEKRAVAWKAGAGALERCRCTEGADELR